MHSLTICFGPSNTVWNLLYKEGEKAALVYNDWLTQGGAVIAATDDFGQTIAFTREQVHGMLLEDLEQSQMAQVERGLHNARTQAKAQTRALADPSLAASMRAQGPAVHSPFPNGRMS